MASFAEYTNNQKKKKKQQSAAGMSFTDYTKSVLGRDDIEEPISQKKEDIAPVKEEKGLDFFDTPNNWKDGYDFGDITKTILDSGADLFMNASKGFFGFFGDIADLGTYGLGEVLDFFGADEAAEDVKKFAQKDIIDTYINPDNNPMTENSVFASTSDSVAQGIGQIGGLLATAGVGGWAGLGAKGVTALSTGATFTSSAGGGITEAYKGGASDDEAWLYGTGKGTVDAATEMLFGGLGKSVKALGVSRGLSSLDDVFAKKLSSKISSQFWSNAAEWGIKAGFEGTEELLAGLGSAAMKKLTYMSDEELSQLIEDENLLEQFVVGTIVSGIAQGGDLINSNISGQDFITGLTQNEQSVVDKEYENRIAEYEAQGETLPKKAKSKLYDTVLNDLKKGYISTDTIEEVLGGESYNAYQDAVTNEENLQKEFDTLNKMKQGEMTGEQIDRRTELKKLLEDLKTNSDKDNLKAKLSDEVFRLSQGSKLVESYNEKSRRGMAFEADLSQYDVKYQPTIKKAVESGILNNSNRTREFVEMVAKISADKGIAFDFSNNEKIAKSSFAVEGAIVNGFVTKDGITVNVQSPKYLNTVVGHEITHILEGTELYDTLQKSIVEYAKSKGDYQGRIDTLKKLYKAEEIDAELTADLVGDYLFTDKDFIRKLSTENRNIFEKIYDEIKYLCKVATAGSKEARELEKVKKAFEDAYRGNVKTESKAVKHSLAMVEEVQPKSDKWHRTLTTEEAKARFPKLWDISADESEVRNPTQISSTVRSYRKVYDYLKAEGFNGTILDASSGLGYGTKAGIEEYGFNVEDIEPYPDKSYNPKYKDYSTLDKKYDVVISNAVLNVLPQDQRDALVVKMGEMLNDGGRIFINVRGKDVDTLAANKANTNISPMEWFVDSTGSYQKGFTKGELVAYLQDALGEGYTVKPTSLFGAVSAVVTKDGGVKYSLSTDSEGTKLTKEQQKFFKDSKMRDDNGNLKVMYHGSRDAGFHIFDAKMSDDETSFFFVDRNDVAASYSGTSETYEARTIRTAEDMNNFLEEIGYEDYKVVEKNGKFELLENNEHVAYSDTAQGIYEEFCWYEGVGEGDANYKVYLNLKNPLVVDAEGRNWNNISREFSQEVADRYNSLTAEEKAALIDLAEWGEYSIFRDEMLEARAGGSGIFDEAYTKTLARAYEKLGGANANLYDAFSIASDNFSANAIQEFAVKQMNTRDYAKRAKEQGYDGVIFNNIVDLGGYSNGSEGASTVAIAFNSNQIKSVANSKPTSNPDIRYSISGKNAKTADNSLMLKAEERLNNGEDSETVRQETGWFKGYDGKMRFEISDRDMDFNINGHFTNPDVIRHRELEYKFLTEPYDITEAELAELRSLTKALEGVKKHPTTLGDYLKHDKLFKAYPELKDYKLSFDKLENGALGKFRIRQKEIVIDNSIRDNKALIEETLIHEIQHAIQDIEGFANGSSESYFKAKRQDIVDTIKGARENLNLWLNDIGYGEFADASFQKVISKEKTLEQHWEDCKEFKANSKYAVQIANCEAEIAEFQRQYDEITNGMTAFEQYENTAGEIEARDVARRRWRSEEALKEMRPDIDRENVVFAETRYSLSEATDAEYMSAVEKGDTETAQRLVKETAKNSGYTIEAYHGTPNTEFTVFDRNRLGKGNDQYGAGFYFASNKDGASHYGNRVIDSALSIKNPIRITATSESGRNLIDADIELTSEQAYEVVKRHPEIYDEENSPLGDYFDSYWEDGAQDWMIEDLAEQYRDVGYLDSDLFRNYPNELHEALRDVTGYDGVEVTFESTGEKFYVAWFDNQMKSVDPVTYDDNGEVIPLSQRFNADNNDIRYSLSEQGEAPTKHGTYNVSGKDIMLEDIAPTQPITENTTVEETSLPDDFAPIPEEEVSAIRDESFENLTEADMPPQVEDPYYEETDTEALEEKPLRAITKRLKDVLYLDPKDTKKIREIVQNYSTSATPNKADLYAEIEREFGEKSWREKNEEVAEVKRFLRNYRINVSDHIKAEYPDWAAYRKRIGSRIKTSKDGLPVDTAYQELCEMFPNFFSDEDIINEADQFSRIVEVATEETFNYRSQPIGDRAIQEAVDIISSEIRTHKDNLLRQAAEDTRMEELDSIAPPKAEQIVSGAEADARLVKSLDHFPIKTVEDRKATHIENLEMEIADNKQLKREAIANYDKKIKQLTAEYVAKKDKDTKVANNIVQRIIRLETLKNDVEAKYAKRISDLETKLNAANAKKIPSNHIAEVMTEEPAVEKRKSRAWTKFKANFLDKGAVFEKLSLKTKNRELQAKYNMLHYADGRAQNLIGKGAKGVKALNDIRAEVEKTGLVKEFYDYLYHKHNVDRMSLEGKYEDAVNKPVFNETVTAQVSQAKVNNYEFSNPKFVKLARDVYDYMNYLRKQLVDDGVISQETADLWAKMYPHYVPIRRLGDEGLNINVPLDTNKTGINAPIKRATGGSRDILPLFDTMALRTIQTFKAASKNSFGVELKNALGTTIENTKTNLDEVIDSIDSHEELLQEGKNGKSPTFTVFENGERVTFEIDEDMYDALKPTSAGLAYTNKVANTVGNLHRGLLTEYNPAFMLNNAVKDTQDVLINSQHPAKTYMNFPKAIKEIATKGKWYNEYISNGGEQNTYFDKQTNTFEKEKSGFSKVVGFPFEKISEANNFIEKIPRLAEYIASRKAGRSVEVSMLDAARVTTNFSAGGDVTKFLNRNGATFLNASVQGAMQQVRNIQEAKANGLKGWAGLAGKAAVIGLTPLLVNALLWDDDEDYEELSDYVKDNYYIVAKYGDGQFVRIPKGRTLAVIQNAFEQTKNALTGDDEIDFNRFFELVMNNIAPNNPIENNILAPIMQVANNETWYGDDLVPTRLQDLPQAEQYDESTDAISKWLGEKLNYSPYKINYLLNQYSGGLGDVFLPMMTPEAERGDDSFLGNAIAPIKDKFTTDSVMKNQNVTDFYNTVDELAVNANSSKATDEDVLKYKYINSVNAELSELYKAKREIQNSTLSDAEKYAEVRAIQEQINNLARNGLNAYGNVTIDGNYATVGDRHFRWYEPSENSDAEAGWQKISDKQLEQQREVTSYLGISEGEYWGNKEEYDYAYENPENYAVAKAVGGYNAYRSYISDLYDIKADKDENGKSISGSRKEKVLDYINALNADWYEKIILFKSQYNADDTYNYEIIDYLNNREDISYEEEVMILKQLGFEVDGSGNIYWD